MVTASSELTPSKSSARRRVSSSRIRHRVNEKEMPTGALCQSAFLFLVLLPLQGELLEHRFPDFFILHPFFDGGHAGVDGTEDGSQNILQDLCRLIVELGGLARAKYLVTERSEVINIDMVLINLEFVVTHVA